MKLEQELDFFVAEFSKFNNYNEVVEHFQKTYGKNYEHYLAWDAIRAVLPASTICEWYKKYKCNEYDIIELAKKALKIVLEELENA